MINKGTVVLFLRLEAENSKTLGMVWRGTGYLQINEILVILLKQLVKRPEIQKQSEEYKQGVKMT